MYIWQWALVILAVPFLVGLLFMIFGSSISPRADREIKMLQEMREMNDLRRKQHKRQARND